MKKMINIIRKIKALFVRFKLHKLFEPFSGFFITLYYLSKLSKWAAETKMPEFNDFYSKKHDYNKRYDLYKHIIESENLDEIYYLEFGIAKGHSFKWWLENSTNKNSRFAGFDTFEGLPEDWGFFKQGEMVGGIPEISDKRCEFRKGLFQDTLPLFLKEFDAGLKKVVHLDADLYSSTIFVLTSIAPLLKKDDILIFDEFNVPLHEFKAYTEFISSFYIKTEVIGAVNNYYQIAFKVV